MAYLLFILYLIGLLVCFVWYVFADLSTSDKIVCRRILIIWPIIMLIVLSLKIADYICEGAMVIYNLTNEGNPK